MAPTACRRLQLAMIIPIILPCSLLLFGVLIQNSVLMIAAVLTGLVMAPLGWWLLCQLRRASLTIGPTGLALSRVLGNETVELDWLEIERLHIEEDHQGLVLKLPTDHPGTRNMARLARVRSREQPIENSHADLIHQERWIPVEIFFEWFERGTLLEDFRRYAPKLAEEYEQASEVILSIRRRRRFFHRAVAVGIAFLFLILAMAVATSFPVAEQNKVPLGGLVLSRLPSMALSLLILLMVPLLGYYSVLNVVGGIRELRHREVRAGVTCFLMAAIQGGFALWIAMAVLFAKKNG